MWSRTAGVSCLHGEGGEGGGGHWLQGNVTGRGRTLLQVLCRTLGDEAGGYFWER